MRLAFLFPRFKLLSGAERLILKLAGGLEEKGHSVSILCHQFDPSCKPLLSPGTELILSGKNIDFFQNRYANAFFDYCRTKSLVDLLPTNLDAVCCFGPALTAIVKIKEKKRLPTLYFCYEPPRFLYTDRKIILSRLGLFRYFAAPFLSIYQKNDRELVKSADRVLTNSEFGRHQIREVYECESRVITHGIDPFRAGSKRKAIRDSLRIEDEDIAVLTANYLHPRKRVDLFLKTLEIANKSNPKIKGVILGDGPERVALEKSAPENVRFTGFIPEESLHEYFQAADIYLHTAKLETFGLSVIEASANYLPVVSVHEGGPLETVLDQKTGLLVPSDAEMLASGIVTLSNDPAKRKILGENGYESIRNKYSWQKGAEDFLSAVRELL